MSTSRRRWTVLLALSMLFAVLGAAPASAGTFSDVDTSSIFYDDIEYIFAEGITKGCQDGTKFCPKDPVTRGEMATFLVRLFNIAATSSDFFTDDNGHPHEADINALFAAGVTNGCSTTQPHYCPDDPVTRGQMASFIRRALGIPQVPDDRFTDVFSTQFFWSDAAAIFIQGITKGCNAVGPQYCPDDLVLREQMAAFLARTDRLGGEYTPSVIITSPTHLTTFVTAWDPLDACFEKTLTLISTANDPDGDPVTVSWTSNVHGSLGVGQTVTVELCIPSGQDTSQPTITATVSDGVRSSTDSIQIKLIVPSPSP